MSPCTSPFSANALTPYHSTKKFVALFPLWTHLIPLDFLFARLLKISPSQYAVAVGLSSSPIQNSSLLLPWTWSNPSQDIYIYPYPDCCFANILRLHLLTDSILALALFGSLEFFILRILHKFIIRSHVIKFVHDSAKLVSVSNSTGLLSCCYGYGWDLLIKGELLVK